MGHLNWSLAGEGLPWWNRLAALLLPLALVLAPAWAWGAPGPELSTHPWAANIPEDYADGQAPWRLMGVQFLGLEHLTRPQALEVMETRETALVSFSQSPTLDAARLERDCARLQRLYQEFGFFEAKVSYHLDRDLELRQARVTFSVQEGPPTLITQVNLQLPEGPEAAQWRELLTPVLKLAPGQRFSLEAYEGAKRAIARLMNNQARPLHKLVGQVLVYSEEQRAEVIFKLDPGPRLLCGPSQVSGQERMTETFILRELTYVRGQPYSQEVLEQSQRALLDTGFFSSVTIIPDLEHVEDGQVPLLVQVTESKHHTVRLGLGWGNEDQLRFRITQVNRNLLGLNDTLTFEGKISYIYYGLVGRLKLPYIINRDTNLLLSGGVEQTDNQAYINRRYFASPVLEYRLGGKWTSYLGYNGETDQMRELKTKVPDPSQEQMQHFISSLPLGLRYDSRDSILTPRKVFI